MKRSQAKCFGATRGEIETRADVNYTRLLPLVQERLANAAYPAVTLGSKLTLVQYGSSTLASTEPSGVPIVRMNNLQQDGWVLEDLKYVTLPEKEIASYRLEPGDILFNRTNSKELVGKCEVWREPGEWIFASYLIRVRTNPLELDPQFASDFLNAPTGRLQIDCVSRQIVGMTNVNSEEIRDFGIPLPPLPVQRELVAAMNAARALRQQQLAEAEKVVIAGDAAVLALLGLMMPPPDSRGVFAMRLGQLQAVGRIDADFYRPGHLAIAAALAASPYPVQALGSLCESPVGGSTPRKGDQEAYATAGIKFLRICNIRPNTFDLSDLNFILLSVHANELGRSQLATDDVLLTITGRVGTAAVVTPDLLPANMNQHLVRLRVAEGVELEPDYLSAYLNTSLGLAISNRPVTGGTRIALDYEAIKNLPIPVPPLAVQQQIVAEVQRRRAQARSLREAAETGWAAAKAAFEARLLGA